jgi:monofunctional biosynthetic peptidoglycan transglycosylase
MGHCGIAGYDLDVATKVSAPLKVRRGKARWRSWLRWLGLGIAGLWLLAAMMLVAAKWINPPTTMVRVERRVQGGVQPREQGKGRGKAAGKPYRERYKFVPLREISPNLQHAVVSAEDARFYLHHGFDWHQVQIDAAGDLEGGRVRGASTITQQLVKNLFFGTGRSILRKGAEASLVPVAELVLGKRRILELYLNEVEWGPDVYGAEAACRYHYGVSARNIGRDQAARLAAILPAPRKWRPQRMGRYSGIILQRMSQAGW